MLKSLFLTDFRGFNGEHEIPLSKLNLLYGPNSSGKSSVLRALKLFSMRAGGEREMNNRFYSLPFERNDNFDGTFKSNVNNQDEEKLIGIGFSASGFDEKVQLQEVCLGCKLLYERSELESPYSSFPVTSKNLLKKIELRIDEVGFESSTHLERVKDSIFDPGSHIRNPKAPYYSCKTYRSKWALALEEISSRDVEFHSQPGWVQEFKLNDVSEFLELVKKYEKCKEEVECPQFFEKWNKYEREARAINEKDLKEFYDSSGVIKALDRPEIRNILSKLVWVVYRKNPASGSSLNFLSLIMNSDVVEAVVPEESQEIYYALESIFNFAKQYDKILDEVSGPSYYGPLRLEPQRFSVSAVSQYNQEDDGKNFPYQTYPEQVEQVNIWLDRMQLPYTLEICETGNEFTGPIITPLLKHRKSGMVHTLREVGFGYSQLLPILSCEFQLSPLVYLEQPEIHLHPKLQGSLADFFIDKSKGIVLRREDGEPVFLRNKTPFFFKKTQIIVETHSESIMLRIQRRIREGVLSPNDVSVIFIGYIEGEGSVVKSLRLDEEGDFIDEWPGGFFEEDFDDVFGLDLK